MGELKQLFDANARVAEDFHCDELREGEVLGSGDIDVLTVSEIAEPGVGLSAPPGAPVVSGGPDPGDHRSRTALSGSLSTVENELYQTRLRSNQDPLNFPIKLNNKIAHLHGVIESVDARPTDQTVEVFELLSGQLDQLAGIVNDDIPGFNDLGTGVGLPPITCTATRTD